MCRRGIFIFVLSKGEIRFCAESFADLLKVNIMRREWMKNCEQNSKEKKRVKKLRESNYAMRFLRKMGREEDESFLGLSCRLLMGFMRTIPSKTLRC